MWDGWREGELTCVAFKKLVYTDLLLLFQLQQFRLFYDYIFLELMEYYYIIVQLELILDILYILLDSFMYNKIETDVCFACIIQMCKVTSNCSCQCV